MRVSTAFRYDQLTSQIGSAERRLIETQDQVTTGKRIKKPSDDAAGTRQLLELGRLRNGLTTYSKNLTLSKGALSSTESAYSDLNDLVSQAQTLTIQGATSTMDQAGRDSIAEQIQSIKDRLVTIGNSQAPDGRYLFGGQVTDQKPFSVDPTGALVYAGNNTVPSIETGPNESVKVGETGSEVMSLYTKLTDLQTSLKSGDINSLSNARLTEIKASLDNISGARADVGRRLNDVADTQSRHDRRDEELAQRSSDIGDVDYATAIVDFTAAQSTYQAALQVASKGFSMSLMDFIK